MAPTLTALLAWNPLVADSLQLATNGFRQPVNGTHIDRIAGVEPIGRQLERVGVPDEHTARTVGQLPGSDTVYPDERRVRLGRLAVLEQEVLGTGVIPLHVDIERRIRHRSRAEVVCAGGGEN